MRVHILTIFPEMIEHALSYGVVGRAIAAEILLASPVDLRDYTHDSHRTTDDTPCGGGGGMVMKAEPVAEALSHLAARGAPERVILTDPQGKRFTQDIARELAACGHIAIICGRYEGVDERIRTVLATEAYSVGDYVLSGGELPALVMVDAIARHLPGVLGWEEAVEQDSFADGLLDFPQYTRPRSFMGAEVPRVLLDGNGTAIAHWRHRQRLERTRRWRADLWASRKVTMDDLRTLAVPEMAARF